MSGKKPKTRSDRAKHKQPKETRGRHGGFEPTGKRKGTHKRNQV